MKKTIFILLTLLIILVSCTTENIDNALEKPKPILNAWFKPLSGGGVVFYDLPDDESIHFVKAEYVLNTGKVIFTKEPLDINYAQWLVFARYTVKQIKWALHEKPNYRHRFVMSVLNEQWDTIYGDLNEFWIGFSDKSTVVIV